MSYCRSGNGSDVYVIGTFNNNEYGWHIMIALNRCDETKWEAMMNEMNKADSNQERADVRLRHNTHYPIGLGHDGEDYLCNSRKNTIEKLLEIRSWGYMVPDRAIERLQNEIDGDNK